MSLSYNPSMASLIRLNIRLLSLLGSDGFRRLVFGTMLFKEAQHCYVDGAPEAGRKLFTRCFLSGVAFIQLCELGFDLARIGVEHRSNASFGQQIGKQHRKDERRTVPVLEQVLQERSDEGAESGGRARIDLPVGALLVRIVTN